MRASSARQVLCHVPHGTSNTPRRHRPSYRCGSEPLLPDLGRDALQAFALSRKPSWPIPRRLAAMGGWGGPCE